MDFFITSINGNCFQNKKIKNKKLCIPQKIFIKGDLKTASLIRNFQSIYKSKLSIFIRLIGVNQLD